MKYFISYFGKPKLMRSNITIGNAGIETDRPMDIDYLRSIEAELKKNNHLSECVILNYILLED